jgi:hypothetical protein
MCARIDDLIIANERKYEIKVNQKLVVDIFFSSWNSC